MLAAICEYSCDLQFWLQPFVKAKNVESRKEAEKTAVKEGEKTPVKATTSSKTVRTKMVAGRNKRSSPFKYATPVKIARTSTNTSSHGGIIKPFKAPGPDTEGRKFTSLKNLEAIRLKKQKNLGKQKK